MSRALEGGHTDLAEPKSEIFFFEIFAFYTLLELKSCADHESNVGFGNREKLSSKNWDSKEVYFGYDWVCFFFGKIVMLCWCVCMCVCVCVTCLVVALVAHAMYACCVCVSLQEGTIVGV